MFRLIRVRLALSYAGIALLVTLALGTVLLVRLRAYYAGMELDYLNSNAKAISAMAMPLLEKKLPPEIQAAQASSLSFLSQTRVRILDARKNVLIDSGPWQSTRIGVGVVREPLFGISAPAKQPGGPSSVIVIQKLNGPVELENQPDAPAPGSVRAPDIVYFSRGVEVSNSVYGLSLNSASFEPAARSNQMVQKPIVDGNGNLLGFVELSESPAYGREIVNSVASGLAVAGGLAILLAVAAGWLVSKAFTGPLLNLTRATQQMSGGNLAVRVAEAGRRDEFGLLGQSFNQMAGQMEETIHTLRRFLEDAAHELQTPLTALRTNLELALGEPNNANTQGYLAHALEQIERLQRMTRDLLTLSRLESGNGQGAFEPVDLKALVRQASEPFAARAEQAGQTIELELTAEETPVLGNPEKLASALGNLLDNALKFTPEGGAITVRLDKSGDELTLAVVDTGIGIHPAEIDMLFNRFHRGRNAANYPGSGLGLAIVRAVAQAHGGSVRAANNPEGGACFTLTLPAAGR